MGLLDSIGGLVGASFDDPRTMGLLSLAENLRSSPSLMGGMNRGLLGYQGAMADAKKAKLMEQMQAMQMQQHQLALEQAQRQAQQQAAMEAAAKASMVDRVGLSMAGGGGPSMANAAKMDALPSFDWNGYATRVAGINPMQGLQIQQALRKEQPKFSTAPQYDQNGRAFVLAEDGSMRYLNGVSARDKLISEDLGGQKVFRTEYSPTPMGSLNKSVTPDALLGANTTMRGQNMTNSLGRDRLAFDQESAGGYEYKTDASGNLVALPKKPKLAGPIQSIPVVGMVGAGQKDANDALAIIRQARELIPKATSSGIGAATDVALGAVGYSTEGGDNAGKLKALEGALVAKMPKMSGPQSDKDVMMYRQMAAEIGNPSTPASRRIAALDEVENIQRRYAGLPPKEKPGASSKLRFLGFED